MAVFKDTTITDTGRALIASALATNNQIVFTKVSTSSKAYADTTDVSKMVNIDEVKQTVNMGRVTQEGTKVKLNAVFTNQGVNDDYKIQTIALYAKLQTGNEILYSVTRAKDPDTMPASNGINLATVEIDLITEINNSSGATIIMNPSTLATLDTLKDYVKISELEGKYMAMILGIAENGYGGPVSKAGQKLQGYAYYDAATKSMYLCKNTNSQTYIDNNNFEAFSNAKLLDKVRNLYEVNTVNINIANGFIKFIKKGTLVHAFLFVESAGYNIRFSDDTLISNYPTNFIPNSNYLNTEYAVISEEVNNRVGNTRLVLRNNGITIFGTSNNSYKAIKGTAVYSV